MAGQGTHTGRTCDQCFFRQAGLCALPGNTVCPTFRTASAGRARGGRAPERVGTRARAASVA